MFVLAGPERPTLLGEYRRSRARLCNGRVTYAHVGSPAEVRWGGVQWVMGSTEDPCGSSAHLATYRPAVSTPAALDPALMTGGFTVAVATASVGGAEENATIAVSQPPCRDADGDGHAAAQAGGTDCNDDDGNVTATKFCALPPSSCLHHTVHSRHVDRGSSPAPDTEASCSSRGLASPTPPHVKYCDAGLDCRHTVGACGRLITLSSGAWDPLDPGGSMLGVYTRTSFVCGRRAVYAEKREKKRGKTR